jgi:hypothetical protein
MKLLFGFHSQTLDKFRPKYNRFFFV